MQKSGTQTSEVAPVIDSNRLKQIVEAALLAADEPLSVERIVKLFRPAEVDGETIRAEVRETLKALEVEADGREHWTKGWPTR